MKAVDILALGLMATPTTATVPVTLTTTVTECAASCDSTRYATDMPAYSPGRAPYPSSSSSSSTETSPERPSSIITYTSQELCTDQPSCALAAPTPPSYTTPDEADASDLPVTTACGPSGQYSGVSSARDSCWPSGDTTSAFSPTASSYYWETSAPAAYGTTAPTSYSPSDTMGSTETPSSTDTEGSPTPSTSSTSSSYIYTWPSYESSVQATETSQQISTPTTFVTNTREPSSSDTPSSTEGSPPEYGTYGTPTDAPTSYHDPPSYTEPPSYGQSKFRAV